jgi:hypothetical protein
VLSLFSFILNFNFFVIFHSLKEKRRHKKVRKKLKKNKNDSNLKKNDQEIQVLIEHVGKLLRGEFEKILESDLVAQK